MHQPDATHSPGSSQGMLCSRVVPQHPLGRPRGMGAVHAGRGLEFLVHCVVGVLSGLSAIRRYERLQQLRVGPEWGPEDGGVRADTVRRSRRSGVRLCAQRRCRRFDAARVSKRHRRPPTSPALGGERGSQQNPADFRCAPGGSCCFRGFPRSLREERTSSSQNTRPEHPPHHPQDLPR